MSKADLRGAEIDDAEWNGATLDGAVWIDGRVCGTGSRSGCRLD
ncbi:hypothetical protein [Desulfonatronum thiodismutans]